MFKFVFATVSWVFLTAATSPQNKLVEKVEEEQHRLLESYIHEWLDRGHIIGTAVAVVRGDKVAFAKAYGVTKIGEKTPVDLDTVFQAGSLTKTFTATLFALSSLKNKLHLEAPLQIEKIKFLPDTKIKHVLSHSTGFSKQSWNERIESGWSREKMLEVLAKAPQKIPGQNFAYSNLIFSLVENEITSVLNLPFEEVIRKQIIDPLEMTRTTIGIKDFLKQENRSSPHLVEKKNNIELLKAYSHKYHDTVASAAGVNSSVKDLAKFLQLQMGVFPKIASAADLAVLQQSIIEAPDAKKWSKEIVKPPFDSYYGYGWRIFEKDGERIVFHGGWVGGFRSFIGFSPKDNVGIVVLNNCENIYATKTGIKFLQEVIRSRHTLSRGT